MRVEQLNENMWAMTYLVECDSTKKVALIDPVWDNLSDYLSIIEDRGLTLEYAMATHTHADPYHRLLQVSRNDWLRVPNVE